MTRNQRLAATRLALHDLVCMTGCEDDQAKDHARRTMHTKARQIVDSGSAEILQDVIHELVHPTCTSSHRPKITSPAVIRIGIAAGVIIECDILSAYPEGFDRSQAVPQ